MRKELNNLLYHEVASYAYIASAILILLLSMFNLQNIKSRKTTVLGTSTTNYKTFWKDLVEKHPTYIDGWIELGRLDKIIEIDPNYFHQP